MFMRIDIFTCFYFREVNSNQRSVLPVTCNNEHTTILEIFCVFLRIFASSQHFNLLQMYKNAQWTCNPNQLCRSKTRKTETENSVFYRKISKYDLSLSLSSLSCQT